MKHLILGIDGGDLEIFKSFEMPFINKIIDEQKSISLKEDLLTRGWAEILTGEKAHDNNSFYIRPKSNGKPNSIFSYKFSDMKINSENKLLWEFPQDKGLNVGIMNVPTTYPAPEVNGFFVSGAGGGLTKVDGIPIEMCDSEMTRNCLEDSNYEVELRFKPSGIKDPQVFFRSINSMMEKRINTFIDLCKKEKTQFGFLALRASANMQYVMMREIKAIMEGNQNNKFWKSLIEEHYKLLDNLIEQLFTSLNPSEFIITSDHGQVPLYHHINFNVMLEKLGYLKYSNNLKSIAKYVFQNIRNTIGIRLLGNNYYPPSSPKIDFSDTRVFGFWYSNGLYVNDKNRFGGIIEEDDYLTLINDVCESINKYPACIEFKITAIPLRINYKGSKFEDNIPDIWIDAPDTFFFRNVGKTFIQVNEWYKPLTEKDFATAPSSMYTGIKGKKPLCIISDGLKKFQSSDDPKDLRLIYELTKRHIESI